MAETFPEDHGPVWLEMELKGIREKKEKLNWDNWEEFIYKIDSKYRIWEFLKVTVGRRIADRKSVGGCPQKTR
jgi:hypothetical protein